MHMLATIDNTIFLLSYVCKYTRHGTHYIAYNMEESEQKFYCQHYDSLWFPVSQTDQE